jgi:exodeoxyribonuclease V beta subunit
MLDRTYGIASFTRLLSDQIEEPEIPEDDAIETVIMEPGEVVDDTALEGIASFRRGTSAGTCLHHIFEELDFTNLSGLNSLVRTKLQAFGITGFDQIVTEMVEKVLAASLDPTQPDLKLANIGRDARLSELEFYFPLGRVTHQKLVRFFPDTRLRFQEMSGFMKGFIDVIFQHQGRFYIVDWKSNWLGRNAESYTQKAMAEEMESKFYHLQLSIYTVALHRLLRARIPDYSYEAHFGGVFYLFLRGIEPSRADLGIWRTRLKADFVARLSGLFGHDA